MIDVTHGIERDPNSDAFGEIVVPIILLWAEPGGTDVGDPSELTGALTHSTGVIIKERRKIDGRTWCRVEGQIEYEGEIYLQHGWCQASLLHTAGASEVAADVDKQS